MKIVIGNWKLVMESGKLENGKTPPRVIPVKAGNPSLRLESMVRRFIGRWIPAFAGMTFLKIIS
jgi:hypothetical protein